MDGCHTSAKIAMTRRGCDHARMSQHSDDKPAQEARTPHPHSNPSPAHSPGALAELLASTRAALRNSASTDATAPAKDPPADQVTSASVISPYRINPLGAHVDHQGGPVLAQTIDQYTVISFQPRTDGRCTLRSLHPPWRDDRVEFRFNPSDTGDADPLQSQSWARYAQAAATALHQSHACDRGFDAVVAGTLIGTGLSSSASVVLAYLTALAHSNKQTLDNGALIELSRQVENDYMGLANGIQDQMSIVHGRADGLVHLDVNTREATTVPTPAQTSEPFCWSLIYSGFSRELVNSGFNTRVAECREAARLLAADASVLGEVPLAQRSDSHIAALPASLGLRARHFFSEIARVERGRDAWASGDIKTFGKLMNASCDSSINQYQSCSEPMQYLHELALTTPGVYGSRFGGGGYGGCLIMLCDPQQADTASEAVLQRYLQRHPDRQGMARCIRATAVDGIRLHTVTNV